MKTLWELDDEMVQNILTAPRATECEFKHKWVGILDDGRVQVRITCYNEILEESVSVITNDDRIGFMPFGHAHIAKLIAHDEQGDSVEIYGYFSEEGLRVEDENLYIDGICKTLISGSTEQFFGIYR